MTSIPLPSDGFERGRERVQSFGEGAGPVIDWPHRQLVERLLGAEAPSRYFTQEESRWDRVHRIANIVIASVLLLVAAIPMALIALAVKLTSPGPVIYTQVRVGQDRRWSRRQRRGDRRGQRTNLAMLAENSEIRRREMRRGADRRCGDRRHTTDGWRCFTMYKFRTMRVDAEQGTGAVWATKNDPRVTPIGAFLRATRLDELPQLVNVIRGDMNIVGPRPERPQLVTVLAQQIEEYKLRQLTKPGITGLAQISHNYDTCIDDVRTKVSYDLEYLRRRSLREDLRIMARTVPVVLKRLGW